MSKRFLEALILYCFTVVSFFNLIDLPALANDAASDISTILKEIEDKDAKIRQEALWKLYKINPDKLSPNDRNKAIAGCKKLLKDPEKSIRYNAAENKLDWAKYIHKEAVPVLIEGLKEKDGSEETYLYQLKNMLMYKDKEFVSDISFEAASAGAVPIIIELMKSRSGDF